MKLQVTPDQLKIVTCPARFIGVFAGRRWGKSTVSDTRIAYKTRTPNFHYIYITPTYAQLIERFRALAFNPGFQQYIENTRLQPFPEITLRNGSKIDYRTFERPHNIKGTWAHEVGVDEIQDIKEDSFWPVIRPLISDHRGNLIVYGQFKGVSTWYYSQFYLRGQDPKQANFYKSWRFPSSTGLRYQGEAGREELALARQQMTRAQFEQQYECIPVANQKAVFDPLDVERCAKRPGTLTSVPRGNCSYILGLDLGRVKDPSAIVVLEMQSRTVVHAEKLPLGMRHEEQAQQVAKIARRYQARVIMDSTGGATGGQEKQDAYLQFYRKLIPDLKPFFWSGSNKERIIHALMLNIEQAKITIPATLKDLIDELLSYEFEYRSDHYDFHGQDGSHDDYVSALAMASFAMDMNWGPSTSGSPIGVMMG